MEEYMDSSMVFGIDGTILDTQGAKPVIFSRFVSEIWNIDLDEAHKYWMDTIGGPRRAKFEYFFSKKIQESIIRYGIFRTRQGIWKQAEKCLQGM